MENVHFNLHFSSDSKTRLFAPEIRDILGHSLNVSQAIPDMDLDTLTVTERKHIEHPNRRKVQSNKHSRRFNHNTNINNDENVFSLQGKV